MRGGDHRLALGVLDLEDDAGDGSTTVTYQLVVDVTIKTNEVMPTNAQFNAKVNEPIVLRVNSDARDQLHVHSTPEHTFTVEAPRNTSWRSRRNVNIEASQETRGPSRPQQPAELG